MVVAASTELLNLLAGSPLFRGASEDELRSALEVSQRVNVERDTFFFHQDEPAESFYLIVEGRLRLIQVTPEGHQVILRVMGPGDSLGIIVVLSHATYPLAAEAIVDCVALRWDREDSIKLLEKYPRLALNGLRLVANHLVEQMDLYRELATERVEQRVARALLRLARQTGKRTGGGVLLDLPLSRQDLGEMTGTTLYTVSRILSGWEQEGLIATGRERVVICKPHGLVAIAEDLPESR